MKLKFKKLKIKKDERGWLMEIITRNDVKSNGEFGLVLLTTAYPAQTKGSHYHRRKKEWYCVIRGRGLLKVWSRNASVKEELEIGEKNMVLVEIPPNYFHSITNIGDNEMYLLAYVSESFNPKDPDTYFE